MRARSLPAIAISLLSVAAPAGATCFHEAGQRYGLNPGLLQAIAKTESGLRPDAVNLQHRSRTGSYDIGLMQINSSWLPKLAGFGITEAALYEPCQNVMVGAWILSHHLRESGADWNGVGAYNASCRTLSATQCRATRARYVWKVYRHWLTLPTAGSMPASPSRYPDSPPSGAANATPAANGSTRHPAST